MGETPSRGKNITRVLEEVVSWESFFTEGRGGEEIPGGYGRMFERLCSFKRVVSDSPRGVMPMLAVDHSSERPDCSLTSSVLSRIRDVQQNHLITAGVP